jgi:Kef-type K+ transport system membrane component KefB
VLGGLADVGLALFMFRLGHELDLGELRGRARTVVSVAAGSVVLPLAGGCLLALVLADDHGPSGRTGFVLFTGVAMAITAFPVLARILADESMESTAVGRIALAAAAIGDVAGWVCLAVVTAFVHAESSWRLALLPVYFAVLLFVVRPVLARLLAPGGRGREWSPGPGSLALVATGLVLSCASTEWLGLHFIFGAFAFGAVMPPGGPGSPSRVLAEVLGGSAARLLLPVYFVVSGLRVDFSHFSLGQLGWLAALSAVAVGCKGGGAYVGARLPGTGRRDSATLAVLMNTRGLTEIVVLSVGLQERLIDVEMYSMMVIVALVTTGMTPPLVRRLNRAPDRVPA